MADSTFATNGATPRLARPSVNRRPSTDELGTTGLRVSGGRLDEEYDRAWKQSRKARTIREMIIDPYVSRSLWTFELLIRNVKWEFEAADDSNEAMLAKEFADGVLFEDQSHSWGDALSNHLSMLTWGWNFHELVWKRRRGYQNDKEPGKNSKFTDGKWGLRKTAFRGQDTLWEWMLDPQGEVQGMVQMDTYATPSRGAVALPLDGESNGQRVQCLLFRLSNYRNSPEGRSLLRSAYIPWYRKKHIATIQGIGIERDLAGLPKLRLPNELMVANPTPDAILLRQAYERMARNVRQDEQGYIAIPSARDENGHFLYEFDLVGSAGTRQVDIQPVLDGLNQEIVIALMTDVILIGHQQVGSLALHSSTTQLMSFGIGGIMDSICEVYNRHFMPRLWSHNALPPETMPKLVHGDVESVDLTELADFILKQAQAGFDMTDLEDDIRRRAGFPLRTKDDEDEDFGDEDMFDVPAPALDEAEEEEVASA